MRRAFLVAFLAGPLPYFAWTTSILRASRPDLIAMTLGSLLLTVPWLWFLQRFARRPMFLLCWFATGGLFFWTAIRQAVLHSTSVGSSLGTIALFPVTGAATMAEERLLLVPIGLFLWGAVSGFVRILRRSAAPKWEHEARDAARKPVEADEPGPPQPPEPEAYFVERPPPKPKGPAYTPRKRDTPPPRPKRVPGA
ncbi:MAG: hypothetical protein IT452_11415 [Planctomycetia bacterium]|nr:hypothetical protein [Planctomycetia bacterium]